MHAQRFHVHLHVADLDANLRFYARLFGASPAVVKSDYAKWMLDDPRLNFAISTVADGSVGIAHLGLQAPNGEVLQSIGARLQAADAVTLAEADTTCCYAQSDKFWAEDPQGIRWESFHTHGEATRYADPAGAPVARAGCCRPAAAASAGDPRAPACNVPAGEPAASAAASARRG